MVKLSLCFIEPQTMKLYGRGKVQVHAFLIFVLYGGEWSALCPGCFTCGKGALGTHRSLGVSQTATMEKTKSCPCRYVNPYSLVIQVVA
jgi:hypothetical protein